MFFFAMTFGYLAFGDNCEGTVLNNYAKTDELANIARIGMGFANVFSFPLMFSGLREAMASWHWWTLLRCFSTSPAGCVMQLCA